MSIFDTIPKPKSMFGKIAVSLTGFVAIFLAAFYVLTKIDFVPDAIPGIGYLDDTIVFILFLTLGWRVINIITGRYKSLKGRKDSWLNHVPLISWLKEPKFWMVVTMLILATVYFFFSITVWPSVSISLGYLDDLLMGGIAVVGFLRYMFRSRGGK